MDAVTLQGLLIPLAGTTLGSACVFVMRDRMGEMLRRALTGFAAGVMAAASIWSLLVPSMEDSAEMGRLAFVPALVGLWAGVLFLLALDVLVPHLHQDSEEPEGPRSSLSRTTMLLLAVTIHNVPEGMAVGVVYAGLAAGQVGVSVAAALALSIGIAVQNFPEGAIISMPLRAAGWSRARAFLGGALSGVVELVAAAFAVALASLAVPALPYLLGFAAGAMLYVVVEELIPEMSSGVHSNLGTIVFMLGFSLMMALDVALG